MSSQEPAFAPTPIEGKCECYACRVHRWYNSSTGPRPTQDRRSKGCGCKLCVRYREREVAKRAKKKAIQLRLHLVNEPRRKAATSGEYMTKKQKKEDPMHPKWKPGMLTALDKKALAKWREEWGEREGATYV